MSVASARGWHVDATHFSNTPDPSEASWYRCDITDSAELDDVVRRVKPDVIVNAAYRQHGDNAATICSLGADAVARSAAAVGARLVHVSTDLVFDGELGRSYNEQDPVSPIGVYGQAKADGEAMVLATDPAALIARTSLIYGRPNAPQEQLVRSAADRGSNISFFVDEWRSPVHVTDLAEALLALASSHHVGVLHVAGSDRVNRFEFASLLAPKLGIDPAVLMHGAQDPAVGRRAKDVSLDVGAAQALGVSLPGVVTRLASSSSGSDSS